MSDGWRKSDVGGDRPSQKVQPDHSGLRDIGNTWKVRTSAVGQSFRTKFDDLLDCSGLPL